MSVESVSIPPYADENCAPFGPCVIEHRSAGCGLDQLGTYFMTFHSSEPSDPWTLRYEETVYVIEGQARLVVIDHGVERRLVAGPGELVVLTKGSTVRYAAATGTRLLLSIAPVNWRDLIE